MQQKSYLLVKGDNFNSDIKFIIKSLNLFSAGNDNPLLDGAITIPEIKRAGRKLRNNKECGQDMISNEMVKCIIETRFIEIILHVFNLILDKSQFSEIWKISSIVPIFKGEDSFDPSNYRGIAITSCLGKLFTLILNDRLVAFLEERKILKPNQIGFRKGCRTADHVFVLNSMINSYTRKGKKIYACFVDFSKAFDSDSYTRKGKKIYACFVDFSKAFDSVWRHGLLYKLIKYKLSSKFISNIQSVYDNLNLSVKLTNGITPLVRSEMGVRQGCNLSPMLFNLFINDLIEHLQRGMTEAVKINGYSCNCLRYADDLLLLSESWTN